MTMQLDHQRSDDTVPDDLSEALRMALGDSFLPARGDQIWAALLTHHTHGSVLWRLAALPTNRSFDSFAEVVASCTTNPVTDGCPRWYA